jgi:hypothetical protein
MGASGCQVIKIIFGLIVALVLAGCFPKVSETGGDRKGRPLAEGPVENQYRESLRSITGEEHLLLEQLALLSLAAEKAKRGDIVAQQHLDEIYDLDVEADLDKIMSHYRRIFADEEGYFVGEDDGFVRMVAENAKHIKRYKGYDPLRNALTDWGRFLALKGPPDGVRDMDDTSFTFEKDGQLFVVREDAYGAYQLAGALHEAYFEPNSLREDDDPLAPNRDFPGEMDARRGAQDKFFSYRTLWTVPVDPGKLLRDAVITVGEYPCPHDDTCSEVTSDCYFASDWKGKSFFIDCFCKLENLNCDVDAAGNRSVAFEVEYRLYLEGVGGSNTCLLSKEEHYERDVTSLSPEGWIHVRKLIGPYPDFDGWNYKIVAEIRHGGKARKKAVYMDYSKDVFPMYIASDQPPVQGLPIVYRGPVTKGDTVEIFCWYEGLQSSSGSADFSGMAFAMLLPEDAGRGRVVMDDTLTDFEIVDSIFVRKTRQPADYDSLSTGFERFLFSRFPLQSNVARGMICRQLELPRGGLEAGTYTLAVVYYTKGAESGSIETIGQGQLLVEIQ